MAPNYKAPGVYVKEKTLKFERIEMLETSIPVFIGFTEKAERNEVSMHKSPQIVKSLLEYTQIFGFQAISKYSLRKTNSVDETENVLQINSKQYDFRLKRETHFRMFEAIKHFYLNGGETCYIISVGTYENDIIQPQLSKSILMEGLFIAKQIIDATMLVVPDAILLNPDDCYSLQSEMINHCNEMENRIALLDIYDGYKGIDSYTDNPVQRFRESINGNDLSYGVAYYPWLNTNLTCIEKVSYKNIDHKSIPLFRSICYKFLKETCEKEQLSEWKKILIALDNDNPDNISNEQINVKLMEDIPFFEEMMQIVIRDKNQLGPASAMAGIMSTMDSDRGFWKAPANIPLLGVDSLSTSIDTEDSEYLNVDLAGKSVCPIRYFPGRGYFVWGARTLKSNYHERKYINVVRSLICFKESIKTGLQWCVLEENNQKTWDKIKASVEFFLDSYWKKGALMGSKPQDAFGVNVGLGRTMTQLDIDEGRIVLEVLVALVKPAEFNILRFTFKVTEN
jgi:phage tail sheath protein FI